MRWALGLCLSLAIASPLLAQSARDEGKALGEAAGRAATDLAGDEGAAARNLPGYNYGNAPEKTYLGNPAALDAAKPAIARTNEASVLVIDGAAIRPVVPQVQIDETTARGNIINTDPSTYVRGVDPNGNTGTCVELPPTGGTSPGTFEATCNAGVKIVTETRSCAPALVAATTTETFYDYWVGADRYGPNGIPIMAGFTAEIASGQCRALPEFLPVCDTQIVYGAGGGDIPGYLAFCRPRLPGNAQRYTCSSPVARPFGGYQEFPAVATGQLYFATTSRSTTTVARDDSMCAPLAADAQCAFQEPEVCTDSSPETRDIDGTLITRACWAWKRDYQCQTTTHANDCSALDANPACHYARTDCLDDPRVGACKVEERVYSCPIPATIPPDKQMLCGGDVYCIGGDCEAVTREASDEFKDAAVGLHALGQAAKEFDQADYRLFKGTSEGCSKPVFGLANCCGGNGIPIIGECSAQERQLAAKIDKGFVHYVGTYCSNSFLGICTSKRRTYCSFSSKLTRILQQQGRPQIGKAWGPVRTPDCSGFTADEFARLDLSTMDFSEIYQDFVTAARLPDEAATMADIQARIRAYYAARGR